MILRKPYAFFIKHFKLIHFLITLCIAYVALKLTGILSFFSEYLQSTATIIDTDVAKQLYPAMLYIVLFVALITIVLVGMVMRFKKKPIVFYLVNTIHIIYTIVVLIYSHQIVRKLELGLVEVRTLKLVQDLLIISFILVSLGIVLMSLRSLGFDIKKFEFGKDIDLQIDEQDREEFELDVNIDTASFKRKWKRNIRNFKYVYRENKNMILLTTLVIIGMICGYTYWHFSIYNKMNKQGTVLRTADFMFGVASSYATKIDYKGSVINDNSFVIVKIKVKNVSNKNAKLETGRIGLTIDKMTYYPTTDYQTKFVDLGLVYVADEISADKFQTYLLVYEVPTSMLKKKQKYLKYSDSASSQVKIKLEIEDIDEQIKTIALEKNKKIVFDNQFLKGSNLLITNSEFNDVFKVNYRFCLTNNDCKVSYEYVRPGLNTNYDKTILKIDGAYEFNTKLDIINANRLGQILANYGTITYSLNGLPKVYSLTEVKPTKATADTTAYLEVPKEIEQATNIDLILHIRNYKYVYSIK